MNAVFICQTVDEHDYILAVCTQWISALARHVQIRHVDVICLRKGAYRLPDNVSVNAVGKTRRIATLANFYHHIIRITKQKEVDFFFVHMGGWYPLLLLPWKLFGKKPIYQWKTHPHIDPVMRLSAYVADNLVFTAAKSSMPLRSAKVKVVGHGIDTHAFSPRAETKSGTLLTIGRITPRKNITLLIQTVHEYHRKYNKRLSLDIIGPCEGKDAHYSDRLKKLIAEKSLGEHVSIRPPVRHGELAGLMNHYTLFVNFSRTGLDKATLEAMACGLPVLSTNPSFGEILPGHLRHILFDTAQDPVILADRVHHLLSLGRGEQEKTAAQLRRLVVEHHSIDALFDKILDEINRDKKQC